MESLTINLNNLRDNSVDLVLAWENTTVVVPIEFSTVDLTLKNIKKGTESVRKIKRHESPITSLTFSPNNSSLVKASVDKKVMQWEAETAELTKTFPGKAKACCVKYSKDGKYLGVSYWNLNIKVGETANWPLKDSLIGHEGGITSIAFSPDDKY